MQKMCPVCDMPFKDGDKLVVVMLSEYKQIESDVHYAITPPTQCVELMHQECYDPPLTETEAHIRGID